MARRFGVALMVICWFAWGFSYPATKIALESLDIWSSRALIMFGAGVILLGLAAVQGRSLRVPRPLWRDLTIAALCNMTVFQIGMTIGVHYFSAGRTAVIAYTMPLWAAVFAVPLVGILSSAVLVDERIGWRELTALGLVGLALVLNLAFPARESTR